MCLEDCYNGIDMHADADDPLVLQRAYVEKR